MSNLRQAAQRALKAMEDGEYRADMIEFSDALIALRAALAEQDRLEGIEAIEKDAGIHVSQQAEPECKCTMRQKLVGDGCAVCNPERAKALAEPQTTHWEGCEAVHPECKATPRKPLTPEQLTKIELGLRVYADNDRYDLSLHDFARAIERAHGITGETNV